MCQVYICGTLILFFADGLRHKYSPREKTCPPQRRGFKPPTTLRTARRAAGGRGAAYEGRPVFQGRPEGPIGFFGNFGFGNNRAEQY
ncbi:MAG: hypothetical protein HY268_11530 [Deltaproteobacteria bacterium]|nr:hypothetical protein [Deltaproteobacteria bacterium]